MLLPGATLSPQVTTPKEAEIRAFEGLVAVAEAIERAVFAVVRFPLVKTRRLYRTSNTAPRQVASHRPDGSAKVPCRMLIVTVLCRPGLKPKSLQSPTAGSPAKPGPWWRLERAQGPA